MPRVQQLHLDNPEVLDVRAEIRTHKLRLEQTKQRVKDYEASISVFQGRIESMDETFPIDLDRVKEVLSDNPCIDPRSIGLILRPNGEKILRWVFHDVDCVPSENPYTKQFDIMKFRLPKAVIEVNLEQNTLKIKPMSSQRSSMPRCYDNHRAVHPHVLTHDVPCLGDFRDNVIMAVQERDFSTVATVIQLYLEQALNSDAAGRTWPRFVLTHQRGLVQRCEMYKIKDHETGYTHRVYAQQDYMMINGSATYMYSLPIQDQGDYIFKGTEAQVAAFLRTYDELEVLAPGTVKPVQVSDLVQRYRDILNPPSERRSAAETRVREAYGMPDELLAPARAPAPTVAAPERTGLPTTEFIGVGGTRGRGW